MKNEFKLGLTALCFALLLPVLASMADEGKNESKGKDRKEWEKRDKDERKGGSERDRKEAREHRHDGKYYAYFHEHGYTNLRIPEGHLPPPGECRVWYPGRPPGQQPPPVKCASAQVPPGAWLMRRPRDDRRQ